MFALVPTQGGGQGKPNMRVLALSSALLTTLQKLNLLWWNVGVMNVVSDKQSARR